MLRFFPKLKHKDFQDKYLNSDQVIKEFLIYEDDIFNEEFEKLKTAYAVFEKCPDLDNQRVLNMKLTYFKVFFKVFSEVSLTANLNKFKKEQIELKKYLSEFTEEQLFDFNSLTKDHKAEKEYLEKRMEEDKKKTNGGLSNTH